MPLSKTYVDHQIVNTEYSFFSTMRNFFFYNANTSFIMCVFIVVCDYLRPNSARFLEMDVLIFVLSSFCHVSKQHQMSVSFIFLVLISMYYMLRKYFAIYMNMQSQYHA